MTPRSVLLLAAVLFLWWLGGHDLWAPDEPYFAEGAREMLVDGKWAVPHVNGVVTPDKPPLVFWLIAIFSLPLGEVTPWTARLPSALAALGTLALAMRLGERLYGRKTAVLAGFILTTTFMFWDKARWSQTDSVLCFLIWVALSAFEGFRAGDLDGRRAGLLFWGAAALAVLDKGPVGFLLPLGIALVVLAMDHRLSLWRRFAPVAGPALFVAVVGAWVTAATVWAPEGYSVWGALREHFIDRGIIGMHHRQPPWYFLTALPPNLMPWLGLVPGALVLAWRRRGHEARLPLVAVAFVLVFFSISTEKRELYALPALPAFALLMAALVTTVVDRGDRGPPSPRWVLVGQGLVATVMVGVAAVLPLLAPERTPDVAMWRVAMVAAVLGLGGAVTLAFVRRRRVMAATLAPGVGSAVLYLLIAAIVYPALEPRKSARLFTLTIKEVTAGSRAAGLPVLVSGLHNLPEHFAYYSDGMYTVESEDLQELAAHFERSATVYAVTRREVAERLAGALHGTVFVIASTHLARRDVLLISNRPGPSGRALETWAPPTFP